MILFLDEYDFAVFRSRDLIHWEESQRFSVPEMRECPDLFELPVVNEQNQKKWVFWSADGYYLVGRFDGFRFVPESDVLPAYDTSCGTARRDREDPLRSHLYLHVLYGGGLGDEQNEAVRPVHDLHPETR